MTRTAQDFVESPTTPRKMAADPDYRGLSLCPSQRQPAESALAPCQDQLRFENSQRKSVRPRTKSAFRVLRVVCSLLRWDARPFRAGVTRTKQARGTGWLQDLACVLTNEGIFPLRYPSRRRPVLSDDHGRPCTWPLHLYKHTNRQPRRMLRGLPANFQPTPSRCVSATSSDDQVHSLLRLGGNHPEFIVTGCLSTPSYTLTPSPTSPPTPSARPGFPGGTSRR